MGKKGRGLLVGAEGSRQCHESELACARREFKEETGFDANAGGQEHDLGISPQPSGKRLHVWAIEEDCNPAGLVSNLFEIEWPPKSAVPGDSPKSIAATGLTEHGPCSR